MVSADATAVRSALLRALQATEDGQEELDQLDALAGDGDHGVTMVLGWRAVADAIAAARSHSPGAVLRAAAQAFAGVGGSAGPLWGTALLYAGRALGDAPELSIARIADAAEAAVEGMCQRGRCERGDRTAVDAMAPAAVALRAASRDRDLGAALRGAAEAAAAGADATASLVPRHGRAARAPDRVLGHPDAGARAAAMFWAAVACPGD